MLILEIINLEFEALLRIELCPTSSVDVFDFAVTHYTNRILVTDDSKVSVSLNVNVFKNMFFRWFYSLCQVFVMCKSKPLEDQFFVVR